MCLLHQNDLTGQILKNRQLTANVCHYFESQPLEQGGAL